MMTLLLKEKIAQCRPTNSRNLPEVLTEQCGHTHVYACLVAQQIRPGKGSQVVSQRLEARQTGFLERVKRVWK